MVNKSTYSISVIIPLFNAEKYIKKAVESALIQKEVKEIIIVEDGSTDNSLNICAEIAKIYSIVKILQHHDKKNHGRSASRNLGIKNSTSSLLAFLDADDFYLPNRFTNDIRIFNKNIEAEGVYNAISAHFYRQPSELEIEKLKLTTVRENILPNNLFKVMSPIGNKGYFSGIGLTVKKEVFNKAGLFNEDLIVAEDTEMWIKLSILCTLYPGIIDKPVSLRGVHNHNVSFKRNDLYKMNYLIMYESLLNWGFKEKISLPILEIFWNRIWHYRFLNDTELSEDCVYWFANNYKHPLLLNLKRTYKSFPLFNRIIRVFRKITK